MTAAMLISDWITVVLVGIIAVSSPGPDFAITLRNSLLFSHRAGVFTALGISVGLCVHTAYSLVGIGVLISQSLVLFNIIKWMGAAYLVYVGVRSLMAKKGDLGREAGLLAEADNASATGDNQRKPGITARGMSPRKAFLSGFLTNVLNPKVTLFFLALFTQIIRPGTPLPVQLGFGLTIVVMSVAWFSLLATLVSHRAIRGRLFAVSHWVERVTGVVFIGLGLRLAASKL